MVGVLIPNTSNTNSYGYLYNHKITSYEDAKENFEKLFEVEASDQFKFKQYVAKNPIIDDRVILSGNRLFFLEPLEATAIAAYLAWIRMVWDWIIEETTTPAQVTDDFHKHVNQIKNFIKQVKKKKCCNGSLKDGTIIQFQGDCVDFIKEFIISDYNYSNEDFEIKGV